MLIRKTKQDKSTYKVGYKVVTNSVLLPTGGDTGPFPCIGVKPKQTSLYSLMQRNYGSWRGQAVVPKGPQYIVAFSRLELSNQWKNWQVALYALVCFCVGSVKDKHWNILVTEKVIIGRRGECTKLENRDEDIFSLSLTW